MILKYSFLKLLKEDMKRRIWTFVLSWYLFFTYAADYALANSGGGLIYGDVALGPGNMMIITVTIIMGIICAIQGFAYLFSEDKTDFYFSIPVTRNKLFLAQYINGLIISLIPCIVSRIICYFIEGSRNQGAMHGMLMGILINVIGFLLVYHVTLVVVMLTGNILLSIVGSVFTFFYGWIMFDIVIQRYSATFFYTFYKTVIIDTLAIYLSPISLYLNMAGVDTYLDKEYWILSTQMPYVRVALVILVAAFFITMHLFRQRPAEAAGKPIAFERVQPILKMIFAIPFALLIGYYIMRCSISGKSIIWLIVGVIFGAFTIHGIVEVIFKSDIKGMISEKRHLLLICIICFAFIGGFYKDIWGYDSYMPKEESLEAISISIEGMDDTDYLETNSDQDLLIEKRFYHMSLTGDTKKKALSWIKDTGLSKIRTKDPLTNVTVAYILKNGDMQYRRYSIKNLEQLQQFSLIYESDQYRKGTVELFSHDNTKSRYFSWTNGVQKFALDLSEEEKETLLLAYKNDLSSSTMLDLQENYPVGTLILSREGFEGGATGYLYSNFENTIKFLERLGIPVQKKIEDYEIKELRISYEEIIDGKNEIVEEKISDKNLIKQLKSQLVIKTFVTNPLFSPIDTKYDVVIVYEGLKPNTFGEVACVLSQKNKIQEILK